MAIETMTTMTTGGKEESPIRRGDLVMIDTEFKNHTPTEIGKITCPNISDNFCALIDKNGIVHFKRKSTTKKLIDPSIKWELKRPQTYPVFSYNIGSDPEIFGFMDDDTVVPAFAYLPSRKDAEKSLPVKYRADRDGMIFWDGWQAEATIPPTNCHEVFVWNLRKQFVTMLQKLNEFTLKKYQMEAGLSPFPSIILKESTLRNAPQKYVTFGCSPSRNVYTEQMPTLNGREIPLRTAGFHLHYEIPDGYKHIIPNVVRGLDSFMSLIAVALLRDIDDPARRQYYGQAGEYRLPKHGMEYRTLSSAALCHPAITHLLIDLGRVPLSMESCEDNLWAKYWDVNLEDVREIINECCVEAAVEILKSKKDTLLKILVAIYGSDTVAEFAWKLIENGIAPYVLPCTKTFTQYWDLHERIDPRVDTFRAFTLKNLISIVKKEGEITW